MLRVSTVLLASLGFALPALGDDIAKSAKAKAEEVGQAFVKEDYGKIIDLTYAAVVENAGGRDRMIEKMKASTKTMKDNGFSFQSNKPLDPQEPITEDGKTYVVVPTVIEMKAPMAKVVLKSYLLGISTDAGKTWTFIQGEGMANPRAVKKVLPNLPAKLKLPELQPPMVVKDD